nr:type II toxin-antitoxin system RnlB family antitoxin [Desulfobacter postgatei]
MSPIEWVEELEACLMKEEYVGNILLDLLLSNGYDRDRFYEIFFDGKKLNFQTLLNVTKVSEELKQVSGEYYSRNSEILDNSVLTKPQRFLIKKKRLL